MSSLNQAIKTEMQAGHNTPVRISDLRGVLDENTLSSIESGVKSGYKYEYRRTSRTQYTITAQPEQLGRTGKRCFFTDETQVIRWSRSCPAGPSSDPF